MVKVIASICLFIFMAGPSSDRIRKYRAVEAFEVRPGIIATLAYTASHDLCEVSIERRHYSNDSVDMDATMPKDLILSLFDELVPKEERGGPSGRLPADTEVSEADLGMLTTRIPYENVTLLIFGKKDIPERQKYVAAIISWNKLQCNAK
jgi:hypothetical protein